MTVSLSTNGYAKRVDGEGAGDNRGRWQLTTYMWIEA